MDELRELVEAFRRRIAGLKEVAGLCSIAADRFALLGRADEAERCAAAIEKAINTEKGSAQ